MKGRFDRARAVPRDNQSLASNNRYRINRGYPTESQPSVFRSGVSSIKGVNLDIATHDVLAALNAGKSGPDLRPETFAFCRRKPPRRASGCASPDCPSRDGPPPGGAGRRDHPEAPDMGHQRNDPFACSASTTSLAAEAAKLSGSGWASTTRTCRAAIRRGCPAPPAARSCGRVSTRTRRAPAAEPTVQAAPPLRRP